MLVAAASALGLVALGFAVTPRLALLRHGVQTNGRVADHHLTVGRGPICTLLVELPREIADRVVTVNVDPETYDRTWIGDEATFYLDPANPDNTSEDPPSVTKLMGFVLACLTFFVSGSIPPLLLAWELTAAQKEERRLLETLPAAELNVTEVAFAGGLASPSVVSGAYTDAAGKRYTLKRLKVPGSVGVGDRIPVLYDHEGKTGHALASLAAFEPIPPPPP